MTDTTDLTRRGALVGTAAALAAAPVLAQDDGEAARKAVAESYLKSLDAGGVSPTTGLGLFDHFTDDAEVFFPKWGVARGKEEVIQMFTDVGGMLKAIKHDYDGFTWHMTGSDSFAVEGTSQGEHRDGPWVADQPKWGAGRFCDCFTLRDGKIARLYIYLDPDYAGKDTARYGWIAA
ncbi:nuclear transport factor 2 family protein [Tabrizicola aquatica]|uniref:nuclear transport factor 2 family protein n=1 Tax=Tabrizicola aquatica TaxID=909926 RepID=UPI0011AF0869|nr:nuclear transport factor 2 family protein [Tabrizicola aquatica]